MSDENIVSRMTHLWQRTLETECSNRVLNMDPGTMKLYLHSSLAGEMAMSGYVPSEQWRGMKIRLRVAAPTMERIQDVRIDDEVAERDRICLYVKAEKPNGRVIYFDDAMTDPAYL